MNGLGDDFGIKVVAYEAGPGWSVGDTKNLQSFILAQRMAPMRQIVVNDVVSWAAAGPNMAAYNHFSLVGMPSRFGMWGHAECACLRALARARSHTRSRERERERERERRELAGART